MPREDWPPLGDSLTKPPSRYYTRESACSCPGWYWRRRCRHVDELQAALALLAANRAKWVERDSENNLT